MKMGAPITIQISQPELKALIEEGLETGAFQNVEELLFQALRASALGEKAALPSNQRNLADLFADSPFAGLDMDFERDSDTGREIEL